MDVKSFYGNMKYVEDITHAMQSDDDYISGTDDEGNGGAKVYEENVYISETDESESDVEKPTTSVEKLGKKVKGKVKPIWKEKTCCLIPKKRIHLREIQIFQILLKNLRLRQISSIVCSMLNK